MISVVGGTATVSQPLATLTPNAGTSHPTEDNTWVHTDTYQLLTPLQCNWINPSPNGAGGGTSSWIQGVEIIDTSGFSGGGSWATKPLGALLTFWLCVFDPGWLIFDGSSASQNVSSETTPINGISLWNCASGPGPAQSGGAGVSSTVCNNVYVSGGQVNFGYFIDCMLDNDVGLHSSVFSGETLINFYDLAPGGGVYIGTGGSSPFINGGTTRLLPGAFLWGPAQINVTNGAYVTNEGTTWVNALRVGTIHLNGHTNGWTPITTGTFTNNGASQVTTTGVAGNNAFPATAPISWSLKTVGGAIAAQPYFSQAQAANSFFTKASAGDTSVYNWTAGPGIDGLTPANLDVYLSMFERFAPGGFVTPSVL